MNDFNTLSEALTRTTSATPQRSFSTPRSNAPKPRRSSYINSIIGGARKAINSGVNTAIQTAKTAVLDPASVRANVENKDMVSDYYHRQVAKQPYTPSEIQPQGGDKKPIIAIPDPESTLRLGSTNVTLDDPYKQNAKIIGDLIAQKYIDGVRYVLVQIK